ncbi:hypothetical protein D9M70_458430 [compost metagenome]
MRGEASGRDRRHCMVQRVKAAHAQVGVDYRAGDRQHHVDEDEGTGKGDDPGEGLFGRIRGFHLEEGHAADTQVRHDEEPERHDPDAAQPMQQRAPEQNARRSEIETGDHRGASRGNARDGFKQGLGKIEFQRREPERHRTYERDDEPEQVDDEEAHLAAEGRRAALRRGHRQK